MTTSPRSALVLFTRDLRLHDHAGLDEAVKRFERVAPLFVFDESILATHGMPNRIAFLLDALSDLRESLRIRGADLLVRRGDPVAEAIRLARETHCSSIYLSADASHYAQARERRLSHDCARAGLELRVVDTTSAVPPGVLVPTDRDHYRVFTPYWRRWQGVSPAAPTAPPGRLLLAGDAAPGTLPPLSELTSRALSAELPRGGESPARRRLSVWLADGLHRYDREADVLAAGATSQLSPYLHFGCISAREVVARTREREGAESFLRQLCWRDFFLQLLAANTGTMYEDLRPRDLEWNEDPDALARWREGQTGYPIVDAAMRQLAREGWMPNRARLIAGSFLTRTLGIDWRLGARVFYELLVDADVANNVGNWQWVAGTGANPRQNRPLNPARQAARFDPHGDYVRRYVPELEQLPGASVHEPWQARARLAPEYPERLDARAA